MNAAASLSRGLAVALLALSLAGCISVFPKETPSQLYRFGYDAAPAQRASPPGGASLAVQAAPTGFDRPAASDAILAITGDQAAYLKGARWVAPATTLFDDALTRAFDANAGPARLIGRGEATRPDYLLKLDVRAFELHYDRGEAAPPTVVVEVYAALTRVSDHTSAGERIFQADVPAEENRAGAITRGFDQATGKVLSEIVGWVNNRGAG